jgi:hypothetical protein
MKTVPLRYLPWMVRDLAFAQGAVLAAVGLLSWLIMSRVDPAPAPASGPAMVMGALQQMALPFLLYCSAAIVSNDRVHGYYRSFFSRPLSPPGYYFTRWILGGVFFVLIGPVLTLGLSLAIGRFPISQDLLGQLALSYLQFGGLIFFFSAFTRGDWLLGLLVLIVQFTLTAMLRGGVDLPPSWDFVQKILPPLQLSAVDRPLPSGSALAHVLLYGIGLVVAGLLLLRLRPLGAGGRS